MFVNGPTVCTIVVAGGVVDKDEVVTWLEVGVETGGDVIVDCDLTVDVVNVGTGNVVV
jgi:hypothetical protein